MALRFVCPHSNHIGHRVDQEAAAFPSATGITGARSIKTYSYLLIQTVSSSAIAFDPMMSAEFTIRGTDGGQEIKSGLLATLNE